jgi:O-antigen ligase
VQHARALLALQALIAWSLFAFGGTYTWTEWPIVGGAVLVTVLMRPRVFGPGQRLLDGALIASLAVVGLQLIPLPAAMRDLLSPAADRMDAALRIAGAGTDRWRPVSMQPSATLHAGVVGFALVLIFWSARAILAEGGVRRIGRTVSILGLAAAVLAIVFRAISPRLLYGLWTPLDRGAFPFGPFVNRNHMVAWLLMAIPLAVASVLVQREHTGHKGIYGSVTPRTLWMLASATIMTIATFVSLSRSGVIGLAGAALVGWMLARRRVRSLSTGWVLAIGATLALLVASYANVPALLARFDGTVGVVPAGGSDRRVIWTDTVPIVRDFPLTGTGVGTFQVAMLVYQTKRRQEVFFNQAHNQYLQIAAEGGLLLSVAVVIALAAMAREAARRLRAEAGNGYWMRAAAVTGMAAVAVQSIWETGLTLPANALLFAVLGAIAVQHRVRASSPQPDVRDHRREQRPEPVKILV